MNYEQLNKTAKAMVEKGKGILAADESTPTIGKRFQSIGVESTYETRNEYRDMLLTANNIEKFISGVIMFDETIKQSTTCEDKIPFVKLLNNKGILPGIKVVMGAKELAGFSGEKITEGLDEDNNNQLACIEFDRIKGGKQFNSQTDWFQSMLKEIGQ